MITKIGIIFGRTIVVFLFLLWDILILFLIVKIIKKIMEERKNGIRKNEKDNEKEKGRSCC
jgi:F0F1-type ATP synthase membrane subunit b/b'